MKVIQEPKLQFTCSSCGAVNEGHASEFREQNTMPPTWMATCGYCNLENRVSPVPLIAQTVGAMW